MNILAFDFGTNVGFAVGSQGGRPVAGSSYLGGGGSQGSKFFQMTLLARKLIRENKPDLIAFEEVIATGPKGRAARLQLLMGYRTCLINEAYNANVKVMGCDVGSIRALFAGKGAKNKGQGKALTMQRCKMLGWDFANDDEADAYAVWAFAVSKKTGLSTPEPFGLFDHASTQRGQS